MKNYLVNEDNSIIIKDNLHQNIFETATNFKDIVLEIKEYKEKNFIIYPFYVNDNLNVQVKFNYLNTVDENTTEYNIRIIFKSRTLEKIYYEDNIFLSNSFDMKIFQQNNSLAIYLDGKFLNIIKESIITYGQIGFVNALDISFKIKDITTYVPSAELGWTYKKSNINSYLLLNENSEYVLENIIQEIKEEDEFFTLIYTASNLKDTDYTFYSEKNNNTIIVNENILESNSLTLKPEDDSIVIQITNKGLTPEIIKPIQLEEGTSFTGYIENKDEILKLNESIFKVPTKNNIDRNAGTLIYKYLPDSTETSYSIFNIGDFNLVYKNNKYILSSQTDSIPNKQLSVQFKNTNKETYIVWTWIENHHKLIIISDNKIEYALNSTGEMNGVFNTMNFSPKNFTKGIIYSVDIYNLDTIYQPETIETYVKYQKENTQNKIFGLNLNSKIEFFKKPFLESSLVPLDGSPILVRNEDGPMQRQFFFDDDTGKYRDFNKEYFTYTGDREIKVAYDHLDKSFTPTVTITTGRYKGQSIGDPVTIVGDNVIKMTIGNEESQSLFGEEFLISYRIKNSYNIEFNEKSANDSYIINLDNPEGKNIIVTQEGDRFNNRKLAKEIELNPILNPRHEGFLYITKNSQTTNSFRIQVSSDMVLADGLDSADILIEAIDEYKNEVLSPYLDVYVIDENGIESTKFGSITPIINYETMKARNTSGRLYLRYNAPYLSTKELNREQKVYIIVYDRKNNIGTQTSLILKPSPEDSKISQLSIPRNGNIPLEYFARYFERSNIPEKVLEVLDYDNNGQLTREDLDILIERQYNQSEMIAATETLKSLEEF